MNKKLIFNLVTFVLLITFSSCQNSTNTAEEKLPPGNHKAIVLEVQQANNYTYLNLSENGSEYWIAVNKQDFNKGDVVYHLKGLKMNNFESKDLDRTFDQLYFVQDISSNPIQDAAQMVNGQTRPLKPEVPKAEISFKKQEGELTIAEIFKDPEKFGGSLITIKGQVSRVNHNIMDRNWVHLQDGTGHDDQFDLTVTTVHAPEVGDIITYEGKVALDKDFGMGYTYKVLVESAVPVEE